jgi:hypothetical protein
LTVCYHQKNSPVFAGERNADFSPSTQQQYFVQGETRMKAFSAMRRELLRTGGIGAAAC